MTRLTWHGRARRGGAFGAARHGRAGQGKVWLADMARLGPSGRVELWFGVAGTGLAWQGVVWLAEMAWHGRAGRGGAFGVDWLGEGKPRLGQARSVVARRGSAGLNMARQGRERPGVAWRGEVGVAGRGKERQGQAWLARITQAQKER